jgi:4-hydroxybenzoate polyprenyltransferase
LQGYQHSTVKTLRGWAGAAHPFPLAMVLLFTALIALASSEGEADAERFSLILLAMLTSQLALGWSNDYLDRDVDAIHQPSKPVPAGLVDARLLPIAIGTALAVCALTGILLGGWPLLLLAIGTACGLAYNLGLKRSRFSAAAFVLAFTVLPFFVWTALRVYEDQFLGLYPIALTLPVAAHVANVLPDIETDRAQERRTIAVALGRPRAIALTLACQAAPLALIAASLAWLDYDAAVLAPALGAYLALSTVAATLYWRGRERGAEVWAFRCLALAAVVFAAGWLAAIEVGASS